MLDSRNAPSPTIADAYRTPDDPSLTLAHENKNRLTVARLLAAIACSAVAFHGWYHVEQSMWLVIVSVCLAIGVLRKGILGIWPALVMGGLVIPATLLILLPIILLVCWLLL